MNGKKFKELFGSRQQVMNGTAYKTAGELTKSHLMMNKWGRIVSRKKHATAKKEKRLLKHGFTAKKGKFGYVKVASKKSARKTKKMRGGENDTPVPVPVPVVETVETEEERLAKEAEAKKLEEERLAKEAEAKKLEEERLAKEAEAKKI
jgi:hypothetical protein